jgi:protein gp37
VNRTKIDWADYSWNPVWGCRGTCPYCYARRTAKRYGMKVAGRDDFEPTWIERNFQKPMPKHPSRIFVNSMSDIADWDDDWVVRTFEKIEDYPEHRFIFLTKRPWKVLWQKHPPVAQAILGFSTTETADLFDLVQHGIGQVSFLSIEPILFPVTMPTTWKPRWIIVGAETGNRKGKITPEPGWIEDIYEYAMRNKIPLFFKESLRSMWPFDGYDYFPQEFPA